jgi:hypothetical protein
MSICAYLLSGLPTMIPSLPLDILGVQGSLRLRGSLCSAARGQGNLLSETA